MWTEIGTVTNCDDVDGNQTGKAYGRRFADHARRDDRVAPIRTANPSGSVANLQALIDVHYYVARDDEAMANARPGYWVGRSTTYTVCTDTNQPGDTELWADAYFDDSDRVQHTFTTTTEADRRARQLINAFRPSSITWDGRAFSGWAEAPRPK